jgi:hypothetical protein
VSTGRIGAGLPLASMPPVALTEFLATTGSVSVTSAGTPSYQSGTWVEVTPSTSGSLLLTAFNVSTISSYSGTAMMGSWTVLTDVGVGGSGSEVVVASAVTTGLYETASLATVDAANVNVGPVVDVPAGSRLAVRLRIQGVTGAGRTLNAESFVSLLLVDPDDVL